MDALLLLLKAKSPETVDKLAQDVFRSRHEGLTASKKQEWAEALGGEDVSALADALRELILVGLYAGDSAAALEDAFPQDFHTNLKKLLVRVLSQRMAAWKRSSIANMVSPPRLVDFDWRVDTKTSSNHLAKMSVPTVFLEVTLQEQPTTTGVVPSVKVTQLELTKQSLATMLDGLGKIRDQLNSLQLE